MSDIDAFFTRANALLERLEKCIPNELNRPVLQDSIAQRWRHQGNLAIFQSVQHLSAIALADLHCLDRQKQAITQNTEQFIQNLPANNVLLWGPRGTGKSSLIKATLNEFSDRGLRLIEVEREHLVDLPDICEVLYQSSERFIIYCDDLSFESNDASYKALKVILDGSISDTPDNVLIYATSNRRHLMPEYMSDNQQSQMIEGELHLTEAIEEKISLSERFGLWLAFHPFNQDQYLTIVEHWITKLGGDNDEAEIMHKAALLWALEHGSRSGRVGWQFAKDWIGKQQLSRL